MPFSKEHMEQMMNVAETLRASVNGYDIESLMADLWDDHHLDATALAQEMGFDSFEKLLLHPDSSQYVQVTCVTTEKSGAQTIYSAAPNQKFAHLREEQLKERGYMEGLRPNYRRSQANVQPRAPGPYTRIVGPSSTVPPRGINNTVNGVGAQPQPPSRALPNGSGVSRHSPSPPKPVVASASNSAGNASSSAVGNAPALPIPSRRTDSDDPIPKGRKHAEASKKSNFSAFEIPGLEGAVSVGAAKGDDMIMFSDGEENNETMIDWDAVSESAPEDAQKVGREELIDSKDSSLPFSTDAAQTSNDGSQHVLPALSPTPTITPSEEKGEPSRAESVVSGPSEAAGSGRRSEKSRRREKRKWKDEERKKLVMLIENLVWFRYPKMISMKELNDVMAVLEPRFVGSDEIDFIELHCHKVGTLSGEGNWDLYWKSE